MEDWAEIRRLHRAEGLPIKLIARTLKVSRNTVRSALASDEPPKYVRMPVGSAVDAFEDAIRAQLTLVPTMPASVIAERVGWTRGMTVFNKQVQMSCARCIGHRIRPGAPAMTPVMWRSAICGSRRRRCRSVMGRPARRCSCRC